MPSKLVFDLQGAKRMTSDMAPKPTFRRGNSENLLRVAPIDPPYFWNFFLAKIHKYVCGKGSHLSDLVDMCTPKWGIKCHHVSD